MPETAVAAKPALAQERVQIGDVDLELHRGGTGPTLVFLHGGGFNPRAPFLAMLAQRFHVVAPSHPGFGTSGLPFWMDSVDDFAHVHLALLEKLDLRDVTLVGTSLGGWVAADIATKNTSRIARIALISPVGIKAGPRDKLDIPDIFAMEPAALDRLMFKDPEKFRLDPASMTDDELRVMARNRETMALVAWEPYMHNPKLKHRLFCIDRPTLMLRGAHDGLVSAAYAEAYAQLIPGCRLETFTDAGHAPQIDQPAAFVARIEHFAKE